MKAQYVFQRHEKKYLLSREQYERLRDEIHPYMQQDKYGLHTICSLYYDTRDFQSVRERDGKPDYKEKLRLRSYGVPSLTDDVFLELKKKYDGVTYKRRLDLRCDEASAYLEKGIAPARLQGQQIFGEIDWFIRQNRPKAQMIIGYDRLALCGRQDKSFRITFDQQIRWRDYDLDLCLGDAGAALLDNGQRLMEIKTNQAIPLWLTTLLSQAGIYPRSFSKYKNAIKNMISEEVAYYVG